MQPTCSPRSVMNKENLTGGTFKLFWPKVRQKWVCILVYAIFDNNLTQNVHPFICYLFFTVTFKKWGASVPQALLSVLSHLNYLELFPVKLLIHASFIYFILFYLAQNIHGTPTYWVGIYGQWTGLLIFW